MTIRIAVPRPQEPELAKLWDEARRSCEQRRPLQVIIDNETQPIWECAKRAAAEVAAWPAWKRNELPSDEDIERAKWRAVWESTDE